MTRKILREIQRLAPGASVTTNEKNHFEIRLSIGAGGGLKHAERPAIGEN